MTKNIKELSGSDTFMDWAYEKSYANNRVKWIAIGIAIFCSIVAVVAVGSVSALIPLQKIEPVVITIDKTTGVTNVVTDLTGDKLKETDAMIMSEAGKYLLCRESYFYHTYPDNYSKAVQMSSGKAREELIKNYAPDATYSPMKMWKDKTQINVTWNSFSFLADDVIQVRFMKEQIEETENDSQPKRTFHIATMRFEHVKEAKMSLTMRIFNPHAFVVTDYQVAMEGVQ